MRPRYTRSGEAAAEAHVEQDLSRLAVGIEAELGDGLRALLLCGPFARGEGRVHHLEGEPRAAAPGYSLIAVLGRRPERYARALATISATWTRVLHARVSICGVSPAQLAAPPRTRPWFHAGAGQTVLLTGDPLAPSRIPRITATDIADDEFAYALCEGLTMLALAELEQNVNADALGRALRWATLACGDALLLRHGLYAASLVARGEALGAAQAPAALRAIYERSATTNADAEVDSPATLEATRRVLTQSFLDLEAERAGTRRDVLGYVSGGEPLLLAPPDARSWTARLGRRLWRGEPERHPLEPLLRAAVALALGPRLPACRLQAAHWLGDGARSEHTHDDPTLCARLRTLALARLVDPIAHPFTDWVFDPSAP